MNDDELVAANREQQRGIYGATLSEVFTDLTAALDISRGRLAALLGLSAPMVSQLASGRRLKIGNPSAVQRLQRLVELAEEVRRHGLTAPEAIARLEHEERGSVLTRTTATPAGQGAAAVQSVLRWAASSNELDEAARLLEGAHPRLAEVLRVYGTGRSDEALTHFAAVSTAPF